jgi:hypothetical protein
MEFLSLIAFITIRKMLISVKERVEQHVVHVPTRIA